MHNINIMFIPVSRKSEYRKQKKIMDISKSYQALASRKFYEIDYIFQEPIQQIHRNIQSQRSFQYSNGKCKDLQSHQGEVQKGEQVYKTMLTNMQRQHLITKKIAKNTPNFIPDRDRTQIIHSRKSPRCRFWKRNSLLSNSPTQLPQRSSKKSESFHLINPKTMEIVETFEGKRMSISMKSERNKKTEAKDQLCFSARRASKPSNDLIMIDSPRRKFWTKNYRPWSPEKHNVIGVEDLCTTIDQFSYINP